MHPIYIGYVYGNYGEGETFEAALKTHRDFCNKIKPFLKKFNAMLGDHKYFGGE